MIPNLIDYSALQTLENIDPTDLLKPSLGDLNFNEIKDQFEDIYYILIEMVDLIKLEEYHFPSIMIQTFEDIANELLKVYQEIDKFTLKPKSGNAIDIRQNILNDFNKLYSACFFDSQQNQYRHFITLIPSYLYMKSLEKDNEKLDYETERKGIVSLRNDLNELFEELQRRSSSEVIKDYAVTFQTEASNHFWYSIRWLVAAIVTGIVFIASLNYINKIIPISPQLGTEIVVIQYVTRLAFISFSIYLVTFLFRQYSNHSHLSTLNKHRQNALDSYQLFEKSIPSEDKAQKTALMIEVAKAIYSPGPTGFISSKNQDGSPSLLELTRVIKDNP